VATFSAPGRCGLVGNPSDIYGGAVVSCSTRERAYATLDPADDGLEIAVTGDSVRAEAPDRLTVGGNRCDVAAAAIQFLLACGRGDRADELQFLASLACGHLHDAVACQPERWAFSLRVWTELPVQAGLGGSSTLLSVTLGALLHHFGVELNRYQMAEVSRLVEARYLKVACGYQDAYMSAFGYLNYMEFRGKERLAQTPDEPLAAVEPLCPDLREMPIMLAHTGVSRLSESVHIPIRQRWEQGEPAVVEGMARLRALATLAKKAILANAWERLGDLMNENHEIVRGLGGSAESNERLIKAALDAGAWSAKLAGAGGGGTIVVLHPDRPLMMKALRAAGAERFLFPAQAPGLRQEGVIVG
jgi:galactokinase/mevalonate kinase-like predicted kinase